MFDRELLAFRARDGAAVIMDARCSHFGANLGKGEVRSDTVLCPYHGWSYGVDGKCKSIPGGCPIPSFAKQKVYPIEERHGSLYVFYGNSPAFPLPWFLGETEGSFAASRVFEFTARSPWASVTGQAFDLQHFLHVHDRRLIEKPTIDTPAPHARRICYRAEIVPRHWRDKFLSVAGGKLIRAELVIWGGTFATIRVHFNRFTSRFLMMVRPVSRQETLCQGIAFAPSPWAFTLPIRRSLSRAFLAQECKTLEGVAISDDRFVESDQPLRDYFQHLEKMHQTKGEIQC